MVGRLIAKILFVVVHIRFRLKIKGKKNIPKGGVIIAMNHQSNWDSLLVGTHTPRKLYIMAKDTLFKNKIASWVITEMGAFPVNRDKPDVKSLKNALRLLKKGKIFSLFIEGSRSQDGEMQDPKKGVGFIVSKSNAPVVPTYIYGTTGKKWFNRAGVVFGEPLTFENETDYENIAKKIAESIKDLKKEI